MKYVLLSSGMPAMPVLNINIETTIDKDIAKLEAGKIAKHLHLAGWYRHDLYAVEGTESTRILSFRTETEEPSIKLEERAI